MKKYAVLGFLLFLLINAVKAQTTIVSGTIKDEEGRPVHFAFLKDVQSKSSTFTDSLGNFTIKAKSKSALYINCFGYIDTLIKVNKSASLLITLKTAVNISAGEPYATVKPKGGASPDAAVNDISGTMTLEKIHNADPGIPVQNITTKLQIGRDAYVTFTEHLNIIDGAPGAILPQFNTKEETQGSRYLYKGWIHGYVVNSRDSVIEDPSYFFEYDKIGGGLLMTKNKKSAIEVDRDMVKSFTLYDNGDLPYTFEKVPQISTSHYVQVIAAGDRYNIYKEIKTTFNKANYSTDGVMSSGHNYDEYTDEYNYYVYDVKTQTVQKLILKKKALKGAFANDADKVNKFMSDHSSDSVDEMYLSELGESLNE